MNDDFIAKLADASIFFEKSPELIILPKKDKGQYKLSRSMKLFFKLIQHEILKEKRKYNIIKAND